MDNQKISAKFDNKNSIYNLLNDSLAYILYYLSFRKNFPLILNKLNF